jgi:hypothetical protein
MILKRDLIPIQDDPENGRDRVGALQGNVHTNAECRGSFTEPDRRVFEGQRRDRLQWSEPGGGVRMDPTNSDRTRVRASAQEGTGCDPGLPEQGDWAQSGADHAFNSVVPTARPNRDYALSAASVCDQVHAGGCRSAGGRGPGARAHERAGYAAGSEARVRAVSR